MNQKPVSAHTVCRLSWLLRINNGELMMAVNGTSRTCTQPKRALDMCTRGTVLSSRPFSSVCDLLWCAWPHCLLMFTPPPLRPSPSLCLSASSRSLSKPTPCRQQGPPQSQVRGSTVQLRPFCNRTGGPLCRHLLSTGWGSLFFHCVWAPGFTVHPRLS